MSKVFVITATVGEYDERDTSVIAVCASRDVAEKKVAELTTPAELPHSPKEIRELYEQEKEKDFLSKQAADLENRTMASQTLLEIAQVRNDLQIKINEASKNNQEIKNLVKQFQEYGRNNIAYCQRILDHPFLTRSDRYFQDFDVWLRLKTKPEYEKNQLDIGEFDILE